MKGITVINSFTGGEITINGKVYRNVSGHMEVTDKGIFVNGKPIEEWGEAPVVKIELHGNVENIISENADVEVKGNATSVNTKNGNIGIGGDVLGNVDTKNGNVSISGKVEGDVTTKNGNICHA